MLHRRNKTARKRAPWRPACIWGEYSQVAAALTPQTPVFVRVFTLLLFCCTLVRAPSLHACSTPVPDSWFVETITVDEHMLPQGVQLQVASPQPPDQPNTILTLQNSSTTPLYLLTRQWPPNAAIAPVLVTLPEGMMPTFKAVAQRTYEWTQNPQNVDPEMIWLERPDLPLAISIWQNKVGSLRGDIIIDLEPRNPSFEVRPTAISAPPAQTVDIPLVYGDRLLHLPLTITYALNPSYDARTVPRGNPCDNLPTAPAPPTTENTAGQGASTNISRGLLVILGVVGIAAIVAYAGRRRR